MATKKNKTNWYFDKSTEEAIKRFNSSTNIADREETYKNEIYPALNKLVKGLFYTYKFNISIKNENHDYLISECVIHLTTCLNKFDVTKNKRAFSYFNSIAKHWLIFQSAQSQKQEQTSEHFIPLMDNNNKIQYDFEQEASKHPNCTDYIKEFSSELEKHKNRLNKMYADVKSNPPQKHFKNLLKVIIAMEHIIANMDSLDIISKKGLMVYLKNLTGLQNSQISTNLKRLRKSYTIAKREAIKEYHK